MWGFVKRCRYQDYFYYRINEQNSSKTSCGCSLEKSCSCVEIIVKIVIRLLDENTVETVYLYSSRAKDGVIEYNGVVFVGDPKTNSLNLGDMSDKNHVLRIQLSGGGFLNVNYDNIGDLKDAMGMFSGKDQGIILKAIATYNFESGFVKAAEEEEDDTVKKLSGEESSPELEQGPQSEAEIAMEKMKYNGLSLYDKLIANSNDDKISVGPSKVEVPKWEP